MGELAFSAYRKLVQRKAGDGCFLGDMGVSENVVYLKIFLLNRNMMEHDNKPLDFEVPSFQTNPALSFRFETQFEMKRLKLL